MAVSPIKNIRIRTESFTSESVSVAANTEATIGITFTVPSGYTAVGILDFNVENRNFCAAGARISASTTAQIRGKNTSASAITTTGTVTILFAPN